MTMANRQSLTTIIIGKTGSGKSALANTLLDLPGEENGFAFRVGVDSHRVTVEPQKYTKMIEKVELTVIDTPGYFDQFLGARETSTDILKAILLAEDEITAFILVMRYDELDSGAKIFEEIQKMIPALVVNKTLIVFTRVTGKFGPGGARAARKLNEKLSGGTLGVDFLAVNETDAANDAEKRRIRLEIIQSLQTKARNSIEPLTRTSFNGFAKIRFSEIIHSMKKEKVTRQSLRISNQINMAILEEFITSDDLEDEIRKRNSWCVLM